MTDQTLTSTSFTPMTRNHATSSLQPGMAKVPTRRLRSSDGPSSNIIPTRRPSHSRNHCSIPPNASFTSGSSHCYRDRDRVKTNLNRSQSYHPPSRFIQISSSSSCSFEMSQRKTHNTTKSSSSLSGLTLHPAIQRIAPIATPTPPLAQSSRPSASRRSTGTPRHLPSPPATRPPLSSWRYGHTGQTRSLSSKSNAMPTATMMARSPSNPIPGDSDGLPFPARSASYQPVSRNKTPTSTITRPSPSRAFTEAGTLRGETLSFTPMPDLLRSRLGSPSDEHSPSLSRTSSHFSQPRTPMYTPSPRPPTDCISYFPPYEGSVEPSMDLDEEDKSNETEEETKDDESTKRHSRGSSISAFANAIISAIPFVRASPTKSTIALPSVSTNGAEAKQSCTIKQVYPAKLTPIPTSEWPCGTAKDRKRRKGSEAEVDKMMLATVKREGPRNKDELDDVENLLFHTSRSSKRRPQLTLPMPTKTWHPALPSPPVVAISPITASPVVEFTPSTRSLVSIIKCQSGTGSDDKDFQPVNNPASINAVPAPVTPDPLVKPIDSAHIPTHHRGRSTTIRDMAAVETALSSGPLCNDTTVSPAFSSPTRARPGVADLFPGLKIDMDITKPATWPSDPEDKDSEDEDEEEDGDITPKAGRGGWIKREMIEGGNAYLQLP